MSRKLIYQLFCGRLPDANILDHPGLVFKKMIPFQWQKLKDDGFDIVYLLGVWDTTGPVIVGDEEGTDIREYKNRRPSPFAVNDHMTPHPDLGSSNDLKILIRTIKTAGLKVIVDFVPNHTGLKHPWLNDHRDYYKNIDLRAFSGDVVELNYDNPQLRREMTGVLMEIAGFGVDGFRCDMAHLVPTFFWEEAIRKVKSKYSDLLFIAEAYAQSVFDWSPQNGLLKAGFDAIYDEPLYRNLKGVKGKEGLANMVGHLKYIARTDNAACWVHYCSNHDDSFPQASKTAILWQVICLCLPGYHLIYNGFWQGQTKRLAHHWVELLAKDKLPEHETDIRLVKLIRWLKADAPELKQIKYIDEKVCLTLSTAESDFRMTVNFGDNSWQICRDSIG